MITYRTDGVWGTGKGSNLTPAEVDANFYDLQQRIDNALNGIAPATGISDISYSNGTVTFELTDATTRGPFELPVAVFNWRGRFAPSTDYAEMDMLFHPATGGYLVLQDHTSASSFDPDRTIGGVPVYRRLFRLVPGGHLPVINKSDATVTLGLPDINSYLRMTSASPSVIELPLNADVAIPVGSEFTIRAVGNASVTFTADTDVTINYPEDQTGTAVLGDVAYLKKVNTDEWDVWFSRVIDVSTEIVTSPSEMTESTSESEAPSGITFTAGIGSNNRRGYQSGAFGSIGDPALDAFYDRRNQDVCIMRLPGDHTSVGNVAVTISGLGIPGGETTASFTLASYDPSSNTTTYVLYSILNLQSEEEYVISSIEADSESESEPTPSAPNLYAASDGGSYVGYRAGYYEPGDLGEVTGPIDGLVVLSLFHDSDEDTLSMQVNGDTTGLGITGVSIDEAPIEFDTGYPIYDSEWDVTIYVAVLTDSPMEDSTGYVITMDTNT